MFEAKFPFLTLRFGLTASQKLVEHRFEQLPGPVPVGITQRRAFGGLVYSQMPQLAFAGRQATRDFPQALCVAQLAEHHRDELGPAGKVSRVPFGLMVADRRLEFRPRDQLQNLTEDAAYSVQGGIPVRLILVLAEPQFNLSRIPPAGLCLSHSRPVARNLIWTRVVFYGLTTRLAVEPNGKKKLNDL